MLHLTELLCNPHLFKTVMYHAPTVLDPGAHAHLSYTARSTHEHAANLTTVPLLDEEAVLAGAHYVIVFPVQGSARPLALLGLTNRNRYLDAEGRWTAPYIPACVRRYPFVLGESSTPDGKLHLAFDAQAPHFAGQGEPLFTPAGDPSPVTQSALEFLSTYHRAAQRSDAFYQPLLDAAVIVGKDLSQTQDGKTHLIGGFGVVDRDRLHALPDATLAAWARSGLLATVYAHWASLRHLQALVAAEARPAQGLN